MIIQDSTLVRQYCEGNEGALATLLTRHQSSVLGFIISKVQDRDVAEDIFQDTFFKVIVTLKEGRYNEEGKFLPWVMRIAHNLVIDYFRAGKKMPTIRETSYPEDEFNIFDLISDPELSIENSMIKEQILSDVSKLIPFLPEDQQEIIQLRIFKEMNFKDIAEKTDVSINTALGRMRYALINLRKLVEEHQMILTTQ